ncbi:MAG: hypothetical protein JSV41_01335 [Gemmatimonadota bacterium]|nr:MAG: hypothetical protein JSV41_01335 [Gemmatimonadota bacterium]
MSTQRQKTLPFIVVLVAIAVLALGIVLPTSGALEPMEGFVRRWFFAVFCTLYAMAQARVYRMRRRRQARVASDMPVFSFGFFMLLWFVLAVAAVIYGIVGPGGRWETAAWVTVGLVVSVQLVILGRLQRRTETEGG